MLRQIEIGGGHKMKRKIAVLAAVLLAIGLTACGNNQTQATNDTAQTILTESPKNAETKSNPEEKADQAVISESPSNTANETAGDNSSEDTESTNEHSDVLVVYFSATGNTKGVAEKIAGITGADTYEIKAAQEYTDADLNWNDSKSRSTKEQNDPSARPEIGSDAISLDGYTTVYIGYPIWWGEAPRIMDTFVESYSFDGITMIPFCTSGSSGIGKSGKNLADNAGSGTWLDGKRFGAGASEDEISSWIEGLQ
jgi:flavodoxin